MSNQYIKTENTFFVEDIEGVWNNIPEDEKNILKITIGSYVHDGESQFKEIYRGRPLIYDNKESAKHAFFRIYADSKFKLFKIRDYQKILDELCNFENWSDNVKQNNKTLTVQANAIEEEKLGKTKSGATDGNSLVEKTKLKLLLSMKDTEYNENPIPANTFTQAGTMENSKTDFKNEVDTTYSNLIQSSNSSKDFINFLNLKLPNLRAEFWKSFNIMFV